MARVCEEWFPEINGFYMDDNLKTQIDVMLRNVTKDWDFTILISGQGEMRVGKSLLGLQIGAYWTYQMKKLHNIDVPFNVNQNVVFNGTDLVRKGMNLGKKHNYSALDYDEAADDMEGTKVMKGSAQQVKDYLRKSAQFNMLNIIIQSEFFEVPKYLAISRSSFLLDVTYSADDYGNFKRGYFRFYSRRSKKRLYLLGKKMLDYNAVNPDFKGTYPHFYPINEEEYRNEKRQSLLKWDRLTAKEERRTEWLRACLKYFYEKGMTHREIEKLICDRSKIPIVHQTIGRFLEGDKMEEDDSDEGTQS